ncbi:MAG: DUF2799 domain-containing protein [Gammaproteobacteria bacterium]|nr:DUF2799 domain-containing protein [Gammaproteobacteria bacterium]
MNSKWILVGLFLALASLGGCASMSSDECMASDWSAIGYEDGSRGYTSDRFSQHRKACAKHGVTADFSAYQTGREQGLVEYCQPGRGFSVGVNGGGYNGVCSANLEGDFLDAYNAGHHLYTLRSNVNRATSSINSKEYELDRIEESIALNALAMVSSETTNEERVLLLVDLKNMSERTGQLQAEIRELQDYRARSQVELDNYQVVLADLGY